MKHQWRTAFIPALILGLLPCRIMAETVPFPSFGKITAKGGSFTADKDSWILKIDDPCAEPAISLHPSPEQKFYNFSAAETLAMNVTNLSKQRQGRFLLYLRDSGNRVLRAGIALNPGETRTMRIGLPHHHLYRNPAGVPSMRTINTRQITSIEFLMQGNFEERTPALTNVRISNIRLEGDSSKQKPRSTIPNFFPFIDRYGQFVHADWKEKIHSDADLVKAGKDEAAELAASSRPAEWNRFGGWKNGPQLKATGNFRTEKYNGKWYFVDPEGKLFFSQGLDVLWVHTDPVKVSGHEHWFAADVKGKQFWQATDDALRIKYGKRDYHADFYRTLEQRLTHWGINTIGDWGSDTLMDSGRIPYTLQLTDFDRRMPKLGPKFYDVYDPVWRKKMKELFPALIRRSPIHKKSLTDPMCIGYFIDNELFLEGRDKFRFMNHVMNAPADKPAKQEFVKDLKNKYGSIKALNAAWKASYPDWQQILNSTLTPATPGFRTDIQAFFAKTMDEYFRICRDAVKTVAPHRLYLGARFLSQDMLLQAPVKACAKYADVLSVNVYRHTPGNFRIRNFPDMPVLIGEYHFSTSLPGRGMFAPDIIAGNDEQERAVNYLRYMQGALVHPNIVGAHWFQFRDQPLTGRADGEGYQIGFVDIADTPYREITRTAREIGENMYRYRVNGTCKNDMK